MSGPILVWRFYDAPAEFRALSTHGGDEDWVAHVPREINPDDVSWAWEGVGTFGCAGVDQHLLPDGSTVLIGAHA